MSHECWECGDTCWCDCDDTPGLDQPKNCRHRCTQDDDDYDCYDDEDDYVDEAAG
jgi:hypothetical protein